MAGNGIESKLEDRGSHKREGTERKKERKKGWRREEFEKERTTDKTVLTQ